jgi:hypothetical protein
MLDCVNPKCNTLAARCRGPRDCRPRKHAAAVACRTRRSQGQRVVLQRRITVARQNCPILSSRSHRARKRRVAPDLRALRCSQRNRSAHRWSSDWFVLRSRAHSNPPSLSPGGGHHFAETGAQVVYFQALREQNPVHRSCRWTGYWACLKDHAPSGAPALAH